ncbi:hypothetical protein [Sphingobium aromaticivastans]
MDLADVRQVLLQIREACTVDITSTTVQLALGDALALALALAVMDLRGISRDHIRILHLGGVIGFRLMPVSQIMHGSERIPIRPKPCVTDRARFDLQIWKTSYTLCWR